MHLCTLKQTTHSKKRAPYRTPPNPRTSAERGQKNSAPTSQHSLHNILITRAAREERRLPPSLHPKALFFFSTVHGALLFLRARRKRRGGCITNKGIAFQKEAKTSLPNGTPAQRAAPTGAGRPSQGPIRTPAPKGPQGLKNPAPLENSPSFPWQSEKIHNPPFTMSGIAL